MAKLLANGKRRTRSADFLNALLSAFSPSQQSDASGADASSEGHIKWYKHPIFRKVLFAIISVLIATLLWGYVLMSQNPDREKTLTGIIPTLESGTEADLRERSITIYGDLNEVLKAVNVTVAAPLTEISKITEKNIRATVSMSNVHSSGEYELEIEATCTIGSGEARVVSVEPAKIKVTVDDLTSRIIPITYEFRGEMPEGYWHDEPTLFSTSTSVSGAKLDLENVDRAVCYIDLNGLREPVNGSIELSILDTEGEIKPNSIFRSVIPSVNVRMNVLPHKHVNVMYNIADRENLPEVYEIQGETLSVSTIDIAAAADVLSTIETVNSMPIYVSGIDHPGEYAYTLMLTDLPSSAKLIDGVDRNNIQLTINVVDRIITETFKAIPIKHPDEMLGYAYRYSSDITEVTLTGPAKVINNFVSSDINVSVNVSGRGAGEYDLDLEFKFNDMDVYKDVDVSFRPSQVHVSISFAAFNN